MPNRDMAAASKHDDTNHNLRVSFVVRVAVGRRAETDARAHIGSDSIQGDFDSDTGTEKCLLDV